MNFLEKHSKKIALALCFATCVPVVSAVYAYETQPGWHGEGADRYYILETTREQATGWLKLEEGTYYFDDGAQMLLGWQTIDNAKYYFAADGRMASGETEIDGKKYNLQADGKLLSGWQEDFLYDEQGYPVTKQYIELEDDTFCYVDENGQKVTGWQTIEKKKHYFFEDGVMATGKTKIDGKTYYLDSYGVLHTGWDEDEDGNVFYRDQYGKLLKDTTREIDGVEYVFDEDGAAVEKSVLDAEKEAAKKAANKNSSAKGGASYTNKTFVASGSVVANAYAIMNNGTPYAYGGNSLSGVDCSGFVQLAFRMAGISVPRTAGAQATVGYAVDPSQMQAGDIVIYNGGAHAAICVGNGMVIHAVNPTDGLIVTSAGWLNGSITSVRRL